MKSRIQPKIAREKQLYPKKSPNKEAHLDPTLDSIHPPSRISQQTSSHINTHNPEEMNTISPISIQEAIEMSRYKPGTQMKRIYDLICQATREGTGITKKELVLISHLSHDQVRSKLDRLHNRDHTIQMKGSRSNSPIWWKA